MTLSFRTALGGLALLAATGVAAPASAFSPYMHRPMWAPPPGWYEMSIEDAPLLPPNPAWAARPPAPHQQLDLSDRHGGHAHFTVTSLNAYHVDPMFMRQAVDYPSHERAGTIVVDTGHKFLFLVLGNGRAMRYGIGTARTGFNWSGTHTLTNKREWPDWTPPAEMLARQPGIPHHMDGGIDNPLGARALYIGSTLYRIHGTNEPWTIGQDVSSGCIRMTNDDVIDLYGRAQIGAKVIVF